MKTCIRLIGCRSVFILLFLLPLLSEAQVSQETICPSQGFVTQQIVKAAQQSEFQKSNETLFLKTKLFIAVNPYTSDTAITPSHAQAYYDDANELLEENEAGIQLEICGQVQYVSDFNLFDQSLGNYYPGIMFPYHEQGYISIVFSDNMPVGVGAFASGDLIHMPRYTRAQTFVHELGHVLGLLHTHDSTYGNELVDGSNCSESGDLICDTPADPGIGGSAVDLQTCTYIGTAQDANGELYTPQVKNIMSYSRCPRTLFTPGQINVMHYVLSDVKSYLKKSESPILINNLDVVICNPHDSLVLTGNRGEGIFDGPNVIDGVLESGIYPGKEFYVTYQPASLPDSSTYIDQSLFFPNFLFAPVMPTEEVSEVSQSFTADANGRFIGFDFLLSDSDPNTFTTSLFQGEGTNLQLLYQTTVNYPGADGFAWMPTEINSPVAVEAGSVYTIRFESQNPVELYTGNGAQWASMDYYPGSSTLSGNRDTAFRTWVHALPACTEAIRYSRVHVPTDYDVTNIPSSYCENEMSTIYPIHNGPTNIQAETLLDNVVTNSFIPSELTLGNHEFAFHVYSEGCTDISTYPFEIASAPEVSMNSLDDIYCIGDNTVIELVGSPLGGEFTVNGNPISNLNPMALGEGEYVVQYSFANGLDTISTKDQWCCVDEGNPSLFYNMNTGETFEQSFTPSMSGTLDSLVLYLAPMLQLHTYEVAIYEGQGSGGNLLGQVTVAPSKYDNTINITADMHPYLEAENLYTLAVTKLTGPEGAQAGLYYYAGDFYSGGEGLILGAEVSDVNFKQYITSQIECVGTTAQTINLEVCSGIDEKALMGVEIYPNPFSTSFTLKSQTDLRYSLYTLDGRQIEEGISYSGSITNPGKGIAKTGAYILKCTSLDGKHSFIEKMVCIY